MIKSQVKDIIDSCFTKGIEQGLWSEKAQGRYTVEVPKHEGQGDFSTNLAMVAAGMEKRKPRDLAADFVALVEQQDTAIEGLEIAGPGFINIFLKKSIWASVLTPIHEQDTDFGLVAVSPDNPRVLVEFVSANPTGPLSVGHGRNAILGDAIARVLEAAGNQVEREYYFNDAGRQMRVLGASTKARYLERMGVPEDDCGFPEDGYQGEYIYAIADAIREEAGDAHKESAVEIFKEFAKEAIFKDIDATLQRIGIRFDSYYNEHTLYNEGMIDDVVSLLRKEGLVYEKDGATWFKTTEMGLEQDRVIIKNTGEPTYRLPDIAYHREKFRRGYDRMINVFGADHIATVPDVLAGVRALGFDDTKVHVVLYQFVTLLRGGKQVKMSTRKATFVTIDELVDEVGTDALRFFFLMRKPDSQLEFDLDLAKKQSQENPVYYVQYAHARLCSIQRQAAEQGLNGEINLSLLDTPEEYKLLKAMAEYPALVAGAAADLAPHRIIFYLQDLAALFHGFYNKHKVLTDDTALSASRLYFCAAVKTVLRNGLSLVGISAPESM